MDSVAEAAGKADELGTMREELETLSAALATLAEQYEGLRAYVVETARRQERMAGLLQDITGEEA